MHGALIYQLTREQRRKRVRTGSIWRRGNMTNFYVLTLFLKTRLMVTYKYFFTGQAP